MDDNNRKAFPEPSGFGGGKKRSSTSKKTRTPVLDSFSKDLVELARKGGIDSIIGRDDEIDKLIQVLGKRKKNNPILLGEPGVGKTAVVEGLALKIANREVDSELLNKRVMELDLSTIVSGTKFRGQFEERMSMILKEVSLDDDVIVFIDEIHNMIGAGGATGSMDGANLIKPALARGEFRCIGATTFDEYKKIVSKEGALDRRFQKVIVNTPNKEDTLKIINQLKCYYEDFHNVIYTEEAIDACVELTDRYIVDRNFPDKAIDVMDEVGVRVRLNNTKAPKYMIDMSDKIAEYIKKKQEATDSQDYEGAAKYRDEQIKAEEKLEEEKEKRREEASKNKVKINFEDVAGIVSSHTDIPIKKITESENSRLASMEEEISSKVVGQDEAVEKVCQAIQRSRLGIQDPNQPIASFMFLGSTGVGKTHLAKELSKYMFNNEDAIIRFDMSEYMDIISTNKLIGSSPGYVGYEEGGILTEKVKNKPYSILLFDEVEKAHPDVFNILLQLLDEGKLTDNLGKEVNFKNTIIIMTSNIGTSSIFKESKLGFSSSNGNDIDDINDTIDRELKKFFRPELLNRVDEKIVFKPLSEEDILKIIDIEAANVESRLKLQGYNVSIDKSARVRLAEVGYSRDYGARPLKRAIISNVENKIAQAILTNKKKVSDKIVITYNKTKKEFLVK